MTSYARYQVVIGPGWLQAPVGAAFGAAMGGEKDLELSSMKAAVKSGFASIAPADALPGLGADVALQRSTLDTDASYRVRILGAWDTWGLAGTRAGILAAMALVGYPHAGAFGPRDWHHDDDAARWARLWVCIVPLAPIALRRWADGWTWGDAGTWGSTATLDTVRTLTATVRQWKSARTLAWIHVSFDHEVYWGPYTMEWGSGWRWGDTPAVIDWSVQ